MLMMSPSGRVLPGGGGGEQGAGGLVGSFGRGCSDGAFGG